MWAAIGGFITLLLKFFGYGEASAAKKKAYQQAVIDESFKYEKGVDDAANTRLAHQELDKELDAEYERVFNPKPNP